VRFAVRDGVEQGRHAGQGQRDGVSPTLWGGGEVATGGFK
jgi:hypothetical protein